MQTSSPCPSCGPPGCCKGQPTAPRPCAPLWGGQGALPPTAWQRPCSPSVAVTRPQGQPVLQTPVQGLHAHPGTTGVFPMQGSHTYTRRVYICAHTAGLQTPCAHKQEVPGPSAQEDFTLRTRPRRMETGVLPGVRGWDCPWGPGSPLG